MSGPKLELSRADVEAVMDYIFPHVRAAENGKGYKVWRKMFIFVNGEKPERIEEEAALPLFDAE